MKLILLCISNSNCLVFLLRIVLEFGFVISSLAFQENLCRDCDVIAFSHAPFLAKLKVRLARIGRILLLFTCEKKTVIRAFEEQNLREYLI